MSGVEEVRKQWVGEETGGEEGRQQVYTGLSRSLAAKGKREWLESRAGGARRLRAADRAKLGIRRESLLAGRPGLRQERPGQGTPLP